MQSLLPLLRPVQPGTSKSKVTRNRHRPPGTKKAGRAMTKKHPLRLVPGSSGNLERRTVDTALSLNENLFEIDFNGKALRLTPREYDLLSVLMRESQRVVSRVELLRNVWTEREPQSRVVDTYICRLRSKLHEVGHPGISVARKRGYRLVSPASEPSKIY